MPKRQTIMLVDDTPTNLNMGKAILKDFYEVYALPSPERLFKFLERVTPDLILLDILMPNMSGFDVIRLLKANTQYASIPVIFVTSKSEETDELEGLALGAVDYVAKPFSAAILLKRIENQLLIQKQKANLEEMNSSLITMVRAKTDQVVEMQTSIINTIAEIVEFRDSFSGHHISRTKKYMKLLVERLLESNIYTDEILAWGDVEFILSATQLHDVGKIFISDTILNKPGKLSREEFEIMKTHVDKGAEAIRMMESKGGYPALLQCAEVLAATHHEKWDGSGYPQSLSGTEIPLLGRLMAIADVYDALTSVRPYKKAFDVEESADIIIKGAGLHFDPVLVGVFRDLKHDFAAVAGS